MEVFARQGGEWVAVPSSIWIRQNGEWRAVNRISVRESGNWETLPPPPIGSPDVALASTPSAGSSPTIAITAGPGLSPTGYTVREYTYDSVGSPGSRTLYRTNSITAQSGTTTFNTAAAPDTYARFEVEATSDGLVSTPGSLNWYTGKAQVTTQEPIFGWLALSGWLDPGAAGMSLSQHNTGGSASGYPLSRAGDGSLSTQFVSQTSWGTFTQDGGTWHGNNISGIERLPNAVSSYPSVRLNYNGSPDIRVEQARLIYDSSVGVAFGVAIRGRIRASLGRNGNPIIDQSIITHASNLSPPVTSDFNATRATGIATWTGREIVLSTGQWMSVNLHSPPIWGYFSSFFTKYSAIAIQIRRRVWGDTGQTNTVVVSPAVPGSVW